MNKREQLLESVKSYVENDKLNLTALRKVDNSIYSRICAVFENMEDFKKSIAPIDCYYEKNIRKYQKKPDDFVRVTFEQKTLRNSLAFDMLNILKQTHTYEEIATKYSVSKQNVQQLYTNLSDLYS